MPSPDFNLLKLNDTIGASDEDRIANPFGAVLDPMESYRVNSLLPQPLFAAAAPDLRGTGAGKDSFLWEEGEQKVLKKTLTSYKQTKGTCFPAGTMVLGDRIKPIEQVQVGDRVWTGEGKMSRVISTRALTEHKPLLRIKSIGGIPLTCTADHKILVYRMAKVGGKRVTPAYYARAVAEPSRKKGHPFSARKVKECYEGRRPVWVRADELKETDCLLTPVALDAVPRPNTSPGGLADTEDGRWLLGYFAGNGHSSGGLCEFATPRHKPWISEKVIAVCAAHGFATTTKPTKPERGLIIVRVRGFGPHVSWMREHFYNPDKTKAFPSWMIGDESFVAGLRDSDGLGLENGKAFDSTSLSLINGMVASLISLGYEPAVGGGKPRKKGTHYGKTTKPLYRVIWREQKKKTYIWRDEKFVCRPVLGIEYVEGPHVVYDIGVADQHHSFVANCQSVSNCVSQGWARAAQDCLLLGVASGQGSLPAVYYIATEPIYAGSRQEVGKGRLGNGEGSLGSWAAKWMSQWGALLRIEYEGRYDFKAKIGGDGSIVSDDELAHKWGTSSDGVPTDLEDDARLHPIKSVAVCRSFEEAADAIANLYPVPVASNQGFAMQRGNDGFCRAQGSWAHQMVFRGCGVAKGNKPFLVCQNSWADYLKGGDTITLESGRDLKLPPGTFGVHAETANKMLKQGDSHVASNFVGFPRQRPDFDSLKRAA